MSLCTPHERTTRTGRPDDAGASRADLSRRKCGGCSSPPTGNGGKRPTWAGGIATAGAKSCWARTGCVWMNGERPGVLTTVKSGPHRIVYCVRLPEATIYIKHFLVPNRRAVLRQWVRRGKGRNEGKRSVHLAAIGVPTITPVALGEQRKRKFLFENYLVTPAISDTIPLDEFVESRLPEWPEPERSCIRRKLARAVAVMTARLAQRRAPAPRLSSRQHPAARQSCRGARALHDRSRRHEKMPSGHLEAGQAEPGAPRSLFLAQKQPDRPVSFPQGRICDTRSEPPPRGRPVCQGNRRHDAPLGGTALAAVGPALPVVEQVLRGLSRAAHPVRGVARSGSI